jgi:hypothetical protein
MRLEKKLCFRDWISFSTATSESAGATYIYFESGVSTFLWNVGIHAPHGTETQNKTNNWSVTAS